jgi:hypothetical protein
MPTQYVIKFIGKISWEGQSNGLPPEIYAYIVYEGDNAKDIANIMEQQSAAFLRMQAMAVQKDQGQIIDLNQTPADRMLVPMCWIVSISANVVKLVGELSTPDVDGVERLTDGTEPVKQ